MAVEISVIIVNFRADKYVERLQRSLRELPKSEVIIIDNSAGSRGYGEGCNLGAKRAKGNYLIFLNPDIETTPESMKRLVGVLKNMPTIGIVGPQILGPDGSIEISCAAFPSPPLALVEYSFLRSWPLLGRFAGRYRLSGFDHRRSRVVPLVGGSCMAVRKADFQSVGGFDENMFLYFEEFDLAYRMLSVLKKQTYFCAEASITHFGQVSTGQIRKASEHFLRSRKYWFSKTYGWGGKIVVFLLELLEKVHG